MNTIAIDTNIYKGAEFCARNSNISTREFIEQAIRSAVNKSSVAVTSSGPMFQEWAEYEVSPEVMAMTFAERKDISEDYEAELQRELAEKYL